VLADGLVGTGHQGNQDVERPRAQVHGGAFSREESLARDQAEGAERNDVPGLRRRRDHGGVLG